MRRITSQQAIGTLADKTPSSGETISGLLVAKDYSYTLLDPRDLKDFAGLSTCSVIQKQKIALGVGWELVKWHLEGMYGSVEEGPDKQGVPTLRVRTHLVCNFWLVNLQFLGHGCR